MSPINKKHTSLATALFCALALWNCGSESQDSSTVANLDERTSVKLNLKYKATPLLDSLVLDCYGTDTLHFVHSVDNALFSMDLFPGDNWKFKAKIYANGALMQKGELETKLEAGSTENLSIQMHPVVGFVLVDIPTGLKNESGIIGGTMMLTSKSDRYEIPMEESTGKIYFKSGMLKLGEEYDVQISLFDSAGKALYSLSDKFLLTEDSPVPNLTLNSLRSKVALDIKTAEERHIEIMLSLRSGYRKPKADNLLITEYFAAPAKDSAQYEFVEIYNGTIDTLLLDDCVLGITSSNTLKRYSLTTSEILPGEVMVLGDVTSEKTPPEFLNTDGWSDMTNSKGNVILQCDGITLDSLYYANATDSLHTNVVPALGSSKYGLSAQLNLDAWKNRSDSSAWKLEKPTPGVIN